MGELLCCTSWLCLLPEWHHACVSSVCAGSFQVLFSHKTTSLKKGTRAICFIYNAPRVAGTLVLTSLCCADHKLIFIFTLLTSKYLQNADENIGHCFPRVDFGYLLISIWVWIRSVLLKQVSEWCPANAVWFPLRSSLQVYWLHIFFR